MQSGMSSFLVLGGLWLTLSAAAVRADDWPQWRGPGRDGVWKETGVVETFDKPQLDLVWRQPIGGGYCGPTVAQGRLYVADRLTTPTEQERILCFDAMTGERLWAYAYEREYRNLQYASGPRASISIDDGRAYALGSFADFHCLDAASGKVLWGKDMLKEYQVRVPQWGIAAAPLVEGDLVVLHVGGSNGACLVAFDKKTGEERWRALNDRASYSAPIIIDQAGKRVLVCLTGERVVGLDLQSGQLDWECPFPPSPRRGPITVASPVFHSGYLFFTNFYEGSLLLKVVPDKLAVEEVWRRKGASERQTDAIQSTIATPVLIGDFIYGMDSYGEFRCLNLLTGDRVWQNLELVPNDRWSTMHFIQNGDKVWLFTERGELMITRLSPQGVEVISRAQLIKPMVSQLPRRGGVCWAHPAFANRHVYARNDEELVCADLTAK